VNLLTNVFSIECFPVVLSEMNIKDKISHKWKNLMKSYPLAIKKYYLERNLLPYPQTCITIGGMYFFYLLSQNITGEVLKDFLLKEQHIDTLDNFLIYKDDDIILIFKDIISLSGHSTKITSLEPFNEALIKLIETYEIIPVKTLEGYIWTLNEEREDLCPLETILKTYSLNME